MDPRRLHRIGASILLLVAAATAGAENGRGSVRFLVQSSPLAGFRHYQAGALWGDLRVGDKLELLREPDNAHDTRAIRVLWRGRMLGYVPKRENAALSAALDRGDVVHARISRLAHHPNPARRLRFDVFLE